jgi:hypothetical protein
MLESFTFWLSVVPVLITYLCVSVGLRWLAEKRRQRLEERRQRFFWSQWQGKGFDVSVIAPKIQRVRQDPIAASKSRPHHIFYRRGLIAVARRMVTHLAYFRCERAAEPEAQHHDG